MRPRLSTAQRRAMEDAATSPEGLCAFWSSSNLFHSTRHLDRFYQGRTIGALVKAGHMRLVKEGSNYKATLTGAGRQALEAMRARR